MKKSRDRYCTANLIKIFLCVYILIHTYTHIYTYTYKHTHTYTHTYTKHKYIHSHIYTDIYTLIHITNGKCMHSHIYKYTLGAHTHDYAHVHAIVKMQFKIVLTRAQPNAHMNNYMHQTDMHVCKHTYMQTHMCMLSLSLPYACSL